MTQPPASHTRFLTGLVGRDIQGSLSPRLHESEGDAQGIRLIYRLFDLAADGLGLDDLPRLLDALQLAGFAGVNVTHPYKQAVIAHLDDLSPQACQIGSVNTVLFRDGRRIGHNTDVTGFAENLRHGLPSEARFDHVVQMGAGGAGAATAHALMGLGVGRLTLFDPHVQRAADLCAALNAVHGERAVVSGDLAAALETADGIVNATPIGMTGYPGSAIPAALLRPSHWVTDIVYFPLETQLLREALAAGCTTLDGSGMTIYQAVGAFEHFTGRSADAARMASNFRAALQG